MPNRPPSYLGQMGRTERVASVVLALQCYGNLREVYLGGERQFLMVARPILRNWGVAKEDLVEMWAMVEFAIKKPQQFRTMCEELDRRKRIPAERVQ